MKISELIQHLEELIKSGIDESTPVFVLSTFIYEGKHSYSESYYTEESSCPELGIRKMIILKSMPGT